MELKLVKCVSNNRFPASGFYLEAGMIVNNYQIITHYVVFDFVDSDFWIPYSKNFIQNTEIKRILPNVKYPALLFNGKMICQLGNRKIPATKNYGDVSIEWPFDPNSNYPDDCEESNRIRGQLSESLDSEMRKNLDYISGYLKKHRKRKMESHIKKVSDWFSDRKVFFESAKEMKRTYEILRLLKYGVIGLDGGYRFDEDKIIEGVIKEVKIQRVMKS